MSFNVDVTAPVTDFQNGLSSDITQKQTTKCLNGSEK